MPSPPVGLSTHKWPVRWVTGPPFFVSASWVSTCNMGSTCIHRYTTMDKNTILIGKIWWFTRFGGTLRTKPVCRSPFSSDFFHRPMPRIFMNPHESWSKSGNMHWFSAAYYDWLLVEPTPLKNMKASWDDDIPNWMEKQKMFQNNKQDEHVLHPAPAPCSTIPEAQLSLLCPASLPDFFIKGRSTNREDQSLTRSSRHNFHVRNWEMDYKVHDFGHP